MHLFLVASLLLVVWPGAPSSFLAPTRSDALVPSSVLAPSSDGQEPLVASLLLVRHLLLVSDALVPSSVLAPSSMARSP